MEQRGKRRLMAAVSSQLCNQRPRVYCTLRSWGNHHNSEAFAGLRVLRIMRWLNPALGEVDFEPGRIGLVAQTVRRCCVIDIGWNNYQEGGWKCWSTEEHSRLPEGKELFTGWSHVFSQKMMPLAIELGSGWEDPAMRQFGLTSSPNSEGQWFLRISHCEHASRRARLELRWADWSRFVELQGCFCALFSRVESLWQID